MVTAVGDVVMNMSLEDPTANDCPWHAPWLQRAAVVLGSCVEAWAEVCVAEVAAAAFAVVEEAGVEEDAPSHPAAASRGERSATAPHLSRARSASLQAARLPVGDCARLR